MNFVFFFFLGLIVLDVLLWSIRTKCMSPLSTLIYQNREALSSLADAAAEPLQSFQIAKDWNQFSEYLPPGSFVEVSDWLTGERYRFTAHKEALWQMVTEKHEPHCLHENQHDWYKLHRQHILLALIEAAGEQDVLKTCTVSTSRTLVVEKGEVHQVKMISKPILQDGGQVTKFISWFIPLGKYIGQPMTCSWQGSNIEAMVKRYKRLQAGILQYLPFTIREAEVLAMLNDNFPNNTIVEKLNISQRTLEKYNQKILSKCRGLFILNEFVNARSAANYLGSLGIF